MTRQVAIRITASSRLRESALGGSGVGRVKAIEMWPVGPVQTWTTMRVGVRFARPCAGEVAIFHKQRTDLGLERIDRRPAPRPRVLRGSSLLIARGSSRNAAPPAADLPDRLPAHEPQAPDLRPPLHANHPRPSRLALRGRALVRISRRVWGAADGQSSPVTRRDREPRCGSDRGAARAPRSPGVAGALAVRASPSPR